jgi:N-acetylmuramoyl-L-alanine amidase
MDERIAKFGVFMLLSSDAMGTSGILPLYYTRQQIEQVFDIGRNYAGLLPQITNCSSFVQSHCMTLYDDTFGEKNGGAELDYSGQNLYNEAMQLKYRVKRDAKLYTLQKIRDIKLQSDKRAKRGDRSIYRLFLCLFAAVLICLAAYCPTGRVRQASAARNGAEGASAGSEAGSSEHITDGAADSSRRVIEIGSDASESDRLIIGGDIGVNDRRIIGGVASGGDRLITGGAAGGNARLPANGGGQSGSNQSGDDERMAGSAAGDSGRLIAGGIAGGGGERMIGGGAADADGDGLGAGGSGEAPYFGLNEAGAAGGEAATMGGLRDAAASKIYGAYAQWDAPANGGKGWVILDAGHGGADPGTLIDSLYEKDIVLDVALRTASALRELGVDYILTRGDDSAIPVHERIMLANSVPTAFLVSIHCDSYEDAGVNGTSTLYSDEIPQEDDRPQLRAGRKALAGTIQTHLAAGLQTADRGTNRNDAILLLRETEIPSVLVELAFISNRSDLALLKNSSFKEKAAQNIASGIAAALESVPALG